MPGHHIFDSCFATRLWTPSKTLKAGIASSHSHCDDPVEIMSAPVLTGSDGAASITFHQRNVDGGWLAMGTVLGDPCKDKPIGATG